MGNEGGAWRDGDDSNTEQRREERISRGVLVLVSGPGSFTLFSLLPTLPGSVTNQHVHFYLYCTLHYRYLPRLHNAKVVGVLQRCCSRYAPGTLHLAMHARSIVAAGGSRWLLKRSHQGIDVFLLLAAAPIAVLHALHVLCAFSPLLPLPLRSAHVSGVAFLHTVT